MDKTNAILVLTDAWFDVTTAAPGVAEITALAMAACIEMPVSLVAPAALPRKPRCDQPAVRSAARWRSSFLSTLLT